MPLIVLGLNHLSAPVRVRQQFAFDAGNTIPALRKLTAEPGVTEAMILSTCNRTELYASVLDGAENAPGHWLEQYHGLSTAQRRELLYQYQEEEAVQHLFRVATGLDSMVLGEPQILGQVKRAYQLARQACVLKTTMHRLLQHTFAVAKRVRTDTHIGTHTVSIASTAVRLAEQVFTDLKKACVLLVGAGENIALTARHLANKEVKRLIIANRHLAHAQDLVARYGGYATSLSATHMAQPLAEADIVIASTSSPQPVITRAMVEQAIKTRRQRPMFLLDIAVPHDIEPEVGELANVFLYDIDALHQVISDNYLSRGTAAREADTIIYQEVERHMAWRRALAFKNPALDLRQHVELCRDELLSKAQAMVTRGKSADEALTFLAHTLTNKLLHHPSARLREAALNGDLELLGAAARLYAPPQKADDKD